MPNRNKPEKSVGFVMRIAAAMQAMGIEGLPRNYELVYEISTGANAQLANEFRALGVYKSQHALDELIRKHLPHHFAVGVMEDHAGRIREEMDALLGVLAEEQTSLATYGALVDQALNTLASGTTKPSLEIARSMTVLNAATHRRQVRTHTLREQVAGQKANLDIIREEMLVAEQQKFTDHLTGLGNRRMFNKELAALFKLENEVSDFAILVADVDNPTQFNPRVNAPELTRNIARVIRSCLPQNVCVCRFDGYRFGFISRGIKGDGVKELAERLQHAVAHYVSSIKAAQRSLNLSLSIGVCMYSTIDEAFDVVSLAERALRDAQVTGAGTIKFHDNSSLTGRSRLLYKA